MSTWESTTSASEKRLHAPTHLTGMLADVLRLAAFAVETGRLPEQISLGELYRLRNQFDTDSAHFSDEEVNRIGLYYTQLQAELAPVTAVSLAATDCREVKDCMNTQAGWHARRMWMLAFLMVALIATSTLLQYFYEFYPQFDPQGWGAWSTENYPAFIVITLLYKFGSYGTPFLYGALGACIHILRVTERHLRMRTFDPRRVPQHRNRVVLGTLSGGIIVLFLTLGESSAAQVKLTAAAAGFLAGYSVDFFFAILDRILSVFVPPENNRGKVPSDLQATHSNLIAEPRPARPAPVERSASPIRHGETPHIVPARINTSVTPLRADEG